MKEPSFQPLPICQSRIITILKPLPEKNRSSRLKRVFIQDKKKSQIISLWMELKASKRICDEKSQLLHSGQDSQEIYMNIFDNEIKVSYL